MAGSAELRTYTRKIARIFRRVETNPERGALLLKSDVGDLLSELKRLTRSEPAVVLEILMILLERVPRTLMGIDDQGGFAASLVPEITDRVRQVMLRDQKSGSQQIDRRSTVERLFQFWVNDEDGAYQELSQVLFDVTGGAGEDDGLRAMLAHRIREMPLVFPPPRGASDDLRRAVLLAERHRCERFLGELLARRGQFDYAVIVAQDHHRRTGDALDLVKAYQRAGREEEAISVARRALSSPRAFQRQRLREVLEDLLAVQVPDQGRQTRKELMEAFVADPTQKAYDALKRSVMAEQWPRVRSEVLAHLQKHQKSPTLLFQLYLEEGEIAEADGLVVTQPVDPDVLARGASLVSDDHPAIAAGWLLFAAHHRTSKKKPSLYPRVVEDLEKVRALAILSDQMVAFERALLRFRSRYSRRTRLMKLLDAAGLA